MKYYRFLLTMLLALSCASPLVADTPERVGKRVKGRLLAQYSGSGASARAAAQQRGAKIKKEIKEIRTLVLDVAEPALARVQSALQRSGKFEVVEVDGVAEPTELPNDPQLPSQWHVPSVNLPGAWSLTTGTQGVPIAIIDSGIDTDHPDLIGKILPGMNYVIDNTDTSDLLGHGTSTAGAAAARTNNGVGVAGAAWDNPIIPVVALNASNWATYSDIASSIIWATQQGARVISISIAGSTYSSTLQSAANYAWNNRAVVFAAAGNAGTSAPYYPAALQNVVAVGSIGSSNLKSGWSNYGEWLSLTAPGEGILTTANGGGYAAKSGTSFSTPLVAGVAALVLSANSNLQPDELVDILQGTADDLGSGGFDPLYGWGRVNAEQAVAAALDGSGSPGPPPEPDPTDTEKPVVAVSSPADGAKIKSRVTVKASASDNVGVVQMEVHIDGNRVYSKRASSIKYGTKISSGQHTISVLAFDKANNVGEKIVTVVR